MSTTVSAKEEIVKREVIVFKPSFDMKTIRKYAEKTKNQIFTKYFFLKSKPEESKIISIDKYFEPFVVIDGKYFIEYSKDWNYSIKVDEDMKRLKINNKNFEPKFLGNRMEYNYKLVDLQGIGRFHYENRKRIVFDQQWNEVRLDLLPYLPFEEKPQNILKDSFPQKFTKNLKAEKEIEILKSQIIKRPNTFLKIHDELFNVTERALVFKPMFEVTIIHYKTQKKVNFKIDGVNGKVITNSKQKLDLRSKEGLKDIQSTLKLTSKILAEKIYDILKKVCNWIYPK